VDLYNHSPTRPDEGAQGQCYLLFQPSKGFTPCGPQLGHSHQLTRDAGPLDPGDGGGGGINASACFLKCQSPVNDVWPENCL
jgi:hypothetical protein